MPLLLYLRRVAEHKQVSGIVDASGCGTGNGAAGVAHCSDARILVVAVRNILDSALPFPAHIGGDMGHGVVPWSSLTLRYKIQIARSVSGIAALYDRDARLPHDRVLAVVAKSLFAPGESLL